MSGRGRGRGRGRAPPSGARLLLQRSAEEAGLDAGNLRGLQDITRPRLFPDYEWHSSGRMGHDQPSSIIAPHGGGASLSASTTTATAPPSITVSLSSSSPHPSQSSSTLLPSNKRAKDSMMYLISKSREIQQWFQESPFYVRPSQEVDVERYNKRRRPLEADAHVAAFVGSKLADSRFVPTELFLSSALSLSGGVVSKSRHGILNEPLVVGDDGVIPAQPVLTLEELAAEELERKKNPSNNKSSSNNNEREDQEGELSDTQDLDEEEDEDEVADYMQDYYASDDESDGSVGDEAVF